MPQKRLFDPDWTRFRRKEGVVKMKTWKATILQMIITVFLIVVIYLLSDKEDAFFVAAILFFILLAIEINKEKYKDKDVKENKMNESLERPKSYEEGVRDGFLKGQEEANKVMEQMLQTSCKPIVCPLPETEAVKILLEQIQKMKCCENCKHHSFMGDELKCNLLSYDDEFECLKTKNKWELINS